MKADCPACGQSFEGDTELSVSVQLVQHVKAQPDTEHQAALSGTVETLDRAVNFAAAIARDDSGVRAILRDKSACIDTRLQTLFLYATSHLALAVQCCREIVLDCGDQTKLTDAKAARRLWKNLQESLLVAERQFRG